MSNLFDIIWNSLMLKWKKVDVEKPYKIQGKICFHGEKGRIHIKRNAHFISDSFINSTSGFDHVHMTVLDKGEIYIAENVGISHANIVSATCIVIEKNVKIGSGVKIWDTDFHSIYPEERNAEHEIGMKTETILIKEGAFIGACSIILKGVTVGKNSVIGAGSVVTKSIPDNEVWAGNPVRFIKKID